MKKIVLSICVVIITMLTVSCSSDSNNDDGGGQVAGDQLIVNIAGVDVTFDVIEVNQPTSTDMEVIARISGDTTREFTFLLGVGSTGTDAIILTEYRINNIEYYNNFDSTQPFTSNVTVNNGAKIKITFSGTMEGWDPNLQQSTLLNFQNGSLSAEY